MAEKSLNEYSLRLLAYTPRYVRHILIAGDAIIPSVLLFHKRDLETIHVLTRNKTEADFCRSLADSITIEMLQPGCPLSLQTKFDAVLLANPDYLAEPSITFSACLKDYGHLLVLCPNPGYWKHTRQKTTGPSPEEIKNQAATKGFYLYQQWSVEDDAFFQAPRDAQGNIFIGDACIAIADEASRHDLACPLMLMLFVPADYNPLSHAQACCEAGHPEQGYELLGMAPQSNDQVSINLEMLHCLVEWLKRSPDADPLEFLTRAQTIFYQIIEQSPSSAPAYQYQAELWGLAGDPAMGARLLRSLQQAVSGKCAAPLCKQAHTNQKEYSPPEWNPSKAPHKVLFVMPPRPHYGLDVLYDGLCTLLGAQHVIDFPQKPFLHGQVDAALSHYLCYFNHPAFNYSLEQICELLQRGIIDCILYGDCERALDPAIGQTLIQAAKDIPLFLVDQMDEAANMRDKTGEYLGNANVAGYFKREMLACGQYGPNAFPLPFAYPDARIPKDMPSSRARPLFWAGHRRAGLRRLYLEDLAAKRNLPFTGRFSSQEYGNILLNTQIGLNFFGFGFDTLRFWELPAHGCMLLSERLPIHIPCPFQDGRQAVFFDDLKGLHQQLDYYLHHPEEAAAIARTGHEYLLHHHSASARARQLLGWIQSIPG
ncbi:MAG TPA: glycosyltransferase [Candidatus Hydrogenedentes bacterium]|nr:glycosyltransferase [Candidatus Hydrogenedentota bacterium]